MGFSFLFLINHNVNLKSKQTCVALNNFFKVIHFEGYQIVESETSLYCRSIIHAASCISSRSILDSFCRRYYAPIELSSQVSLPLCRSLYHGAFFFCISAREKQKENAKLRKCKLVRWHLSLQRPFPSEIKFCEKVVITESSRQHSEGRAGPKHLMFMVRYDISGQTSLDM